MSLLAFKALDYGADKLPDKFWEKIPGGFFTPDEKKKAKKKYDDSRARSERRHSDRERRHSHRESPPTDYTDYSEYDDTDYEPEYSDRQRRRRTKSVGRSPSPHTRAYSRGRVRERSRDLDGSEDYGMEREERAPQFPPPPTAEYRPYNPADYAPPMGNDHYDRRATSARPDYGYPPQVNNVSLSRHSTAAASAPPMSSPANVPLPALTGRPTSSLTNPLIPSRTPTMNALICRSPFEASFSPSFEPPLATLLHQSSTNSPQPSGPHPSTAQSRYTPAGYAPSPVTTANLPPHPDYNTYTPPVPETYSPNPAQYRAAGNSYPTPPPLYRHQSRSQPALAQYPHEENQVAFPAPPVVHGSTSSSHRHRHKDGKHHRARSAGHGRSHSRVTDKFRDRFEDLDLHDKSGLAASVGGALAGGLAGRAVGHSTLSTLVGAAIGGVGGSEMEKRRER
jgi:hypothetical protein